MTKFCPGIQNYHEKPSNPCESETASLRRDAELRAQDLHEPDRRPHHGEDAAGGAQQGQPAPRRRWLKLQSEYC